MNRIINAVYILFIAFIVILCNSLYGVGICEIEVVPKGGQVDVWFKLKEGGYLVKDSIQVESDVPMKVLAVGYKAEPSDIYGSMVKESFTQVCQVTGGDYRLTVRFQGCDRESCHFPEERQFQVKGGKLLEGENKAGEGEQGSGGGPSAVVEAFSKAQKGYGFMDADAFVSWSRGEEEEENMLERIFRKYGFLAALLLLLPLGALLNLTPCVLPMIPINLALIGAGKDVTKKERVLRGVLYGLGMALAYGALGVMTLLGGVRFGAVTATSWFNWVVAVAFGVLGVSMFGAFDIDLVRFRGGRKMGGRMGVFVAGALSAVLAGACVAPVLIWCLILAASLYASGNVLALLLPFMLGTGMALPWPLVAGGLASLPRPGQWMVWVKKGFAVLILLFAVYSGYKGYGLGQQEKRQEWKLEVNIQDALEKKKGNGKPLFVFFRGRVCGACDEMEKKTFTDSRVRERMAEWNVLEVEVESNGELAKQAGVAGVPTYFLIK